MKKTFILSLIILCFAISRKSSAQCPYNNILYISGAAPATVGQVLVAPDTWAGEYNRITGCVAGYTYRISTCSTLTFDSELTVYPAGGGTPIAYNDDFCSLSSELTFVAPSNGSYDLLLDEIGCFDNQIDMDMEIELVSTGTGNPGAPNLTIPVVVHVVYKTTAQNISNAQIQSQIDILNEDFRKQNADQSMVPSIWQSLHADFEIEFCLATEDPSGSPTTGITRTVTSANSFSFGTDMKSNSTGGKNNWNPQKYLNIWVCNLSGGLLGFATFPDNLASNPSSDGVVIDYQYFGDIGSATNPFDLGRTATHEIGHWLNLRHIWGDSNCGSDFVNDTPTQQSSNSNCPSFPSTSSCTGNPPNGDMFMNFMDYVDDDCMHMFTEGQKARSESALLLYRSQLFTSTGCGVSTGVQTNEELNFVNIFPNPNEGTFTVSIDNMSEDIIQLELFNSIGQMVKQIDIVASLNNAIDIDLSKHNAGVYYVRIANENVNTTKKIIVN